MKTKNLLIIIAMILLASSGMIANKKADKGSYVKVIYFHGDYRCPTCNKLEAYSKETIDKYFSKAKKEGRLKWSAINFDKEKNEHYIEKYQLYNKALVLVRYENGKQKEWKNLEKIWEKVGDKNDYLKYLKNEVKKYLGKI